VAALERRSRRAGGSVLAGPAAVLAALLALVLCRAAESRAEPPRPLVFVTLNLLHGGVTSGLTGRDDDLERRLELVTSELRALDPDVVGLQEASTGRGRGNVARRLAHALGLHWVYAPALFGLTGWAPADDLVGTLMNFTEGPAVLSRFPILRSEARSLPRCNGLFDVRVALRADVATPWGEMPVFSTHLSWGACETPELARFVAEGTAALPAVLMGDFNATEGSPAIVHLTRDAGMIDVFRSVAPDAPGPTVWQRPRAPERTVTRRVDYLFLAPGREHRGRALASRVVLDTPDRAPDGTTLWPSDHYAVLATIEVVTGL
jgi:endonuclease/exonuclease/phosphatase family metal-dependent hydrolase